MPRMPGRESVYQAYQSFVQNCLLNDQSLLWPDQHVWTAENIAEIKKRMMDAPIFGGTLGFEEKLQKQLAGGDPPLWQVIADTLFVYFLPSVHYKVSTKREGIVWAAGQGGFTVPSSAPIWEALEHGLVNTSQHYHAKYMQFWLLLLLGLRVKESPDRKVVVSERQALQATLDQLLQGIPNKRDRANDMRDALLHMAFPESYEPIISTGDKIRIAKRYWPEVGGKQPDDVDETLRQIRPVLEARWNRPGFSFYDEDRKLEWNTGAAAQPVITTVRETPPPTADVPPGQAPVLDVTRVISVLQQTHNVVLYGPPGTGKTYIAREATRAFVAQQGKGAPSQAALSERVTEDLVLYDVLALSMYVSGPDRSYAVAELADHPLMQARLRQSPVKHPREAIWSGLQIHTPETSHTVRVTRRWGPFLFDKDADSRWRLRRKGAHMSSRTLPNLSSSGGRAALQRLTRMTTFSGPVFTSR